MDLLPGKHISQKVSWVDRFERRWIDSLIAGQAADIFELCAPEFKLVAHVGEILNRDQLVSVLESRRLVFSKIDVIDQEIRIYSQTALVTRHWNMTMAFNGIIFDGASVMSTLWLEQPEGSWKCALVHSTDARLRDPWKQLTSKPG